MSEDKEIHLRPARSEAGKSARKTVPVKAPAKTGPSARTETPPQVKTPAKAEIPPCPEADISYGDKTPAVVAWWFKHHPEEAAAKYKDRKFELPTDHE